jgi:tubulin-specific chaperone C
MHDSRETRVYLSCSSRPIIENSSGIVFSRYPVITAKRMGITNIDGEDWYVRELVEDFNWLRKEHSPNWRISKEDIGEDIWLRVMHKMDNEESDSPNVEEIRQLL